MIGIITHDIGLSRNKIRDDYLPTLQDMHYITSGQIIQLTELGRQFVEFELSAKDEYALKEKTNVSDNKSMEEEFRTGHPADAR